MKTIITSLLFIVMVALFAITSDKLSMIEQKEMMQPTNSGEVALSDQEFLNGMIEHHEGAIAMAKEVLKKSSRPELKTFAQNIITTQTAEIATMQQYLKEWYE